MAAPSSNPTDSNRFARDQRIDEATTSASTSMMYDQLLNQMPSTSTAIDQPINDDKRQKFDHQLIEMDDTCSNDAFMFKINQNGQQYNNIEKIPAVK